MRSRPILSAPDFSPPVPRDANGPVFGEPWEAQAFAMAVALHERGVFTWPEWAAQLGEAIKAHPGESYYEHWLDALEHMVVAKGVASEPALREMGAAWARAAEATPHGQPIVLGNVPTV